MSLFALRIEAEQLYLLALQGNLLHLPAPVLVGTDGYSLFRPWEVFRPALSQVRQGWRAARLPDQPSLRQRSA